MDFIELHILHHAAEGELYGLWMIEELASHGYSINASQLYPRFQRLERRGLLRKKERTVGGKRRKYYRATPAGRAYLRRQKSKLMELAAEALSTEEIRRVLQIRAARDRRQLARRGESRQEGRRGEP